MLSPYDYWQYWRNSEDADIGRFLKLYTELPLDEIAKLEASGAKVICRHDAAQWDCLQKGPDAYS